jgi:asparagine synthase (glutamine-hydrolysing)
MPGIVGLITKIGRELAEPQLRLMVEALQHESFYETGTWIDEPSGVYVGWTVQKNSSPFTNPITNERGDRVLILSGDVYTDSDRMRPGEDNGVAIAGGLGGSVVGCAEGGSSFPENLNGIFHGLLIDRCAGTATLFNDRFGMHRIYYHQAKEAIYFGAEAKAILAVRPELRTPSLQSLGEFVALSCVLEDRSIFKDIFVLPGASAWLIRNGSVEHKHTYFSPSHWEEEVALKPEDYKRQLRETVLRSLPRYFAGSQKMGIAMTGGLDTRVILACHLPAPGSLSSYTFGSKYRDTYDVRVGRQVAQICQQPHQVIEVGDEFLKAFAHYAERSIYLTEGAVDVYRAADLYVSEKARQIAPVKIVGTYGSEILRHAVMFKPREPLAGLFCPDFLSHIQGARGTYSALRQQHPVTFAAFRQSPWYHHGILALEQSQLTVRSPFMDNDFLRTVYRGPRGSAVQEDVRLQLINDANPALGNILSDRGVGFNGNGLASRLTRAYREFTFKAEYAYDYGMPQSVAQVDHWLSWLRLERLFLGRHKFLHFRVWYRDVLANYVKEMLLDPRTLARPYLERKGVEAIVHGHLKGNRNYTTEIHKLLSLELLHRLFLDPK